MIQLIIETATERGVIALIDQGQVLFHSELPFGYNNSKYVVPVIAEGLKKCGLSVEQLTMIAVGIGPGSYTGIRVGVIVAKTLAMARDLPLIGVCSLEGFLFPQEGLFASVMDAKIGGVYLLSGERTGSHVRYDGKPEICEMQNISERLGVRGITQLVTPYAQQLRTKFHGVSPENPWEWVEAAPDPNRIARIAQEKYLKGEFALDRHLDILYLRKTQAEIEKEAKRN